MLWKRGFPVLAALYLLLGSWKGYVALFDKDREEPRQIFPTQVITLPEQDQQELQSGIPVRSRQALDRLLEDYLS